VVNLSRPIAQVAQELGINRTILGFWVRAYRQQHSGDELPIDMPDQARNRPDEPADTTGPPGDSVGPPVAPPSGLREQVLNLGVGRSPYAAAGRQDVIQRADSRRPDEPAGTTRLLGWSRVRANPRTATATAAIALWGMAALSAALIVVSGGHTVGNLVVDSGSDPVVTASAPASPSGRASATARARSSPSPSNPRSGGGLAPTAAPTAPPTAPRPKASPSRSPKPSKSAPPLPSASSPPSQTPTPSSIPTPSSTPTSHPPPHRQLRHPRHTSRWSTTPPRWRPRYRPTRGPSRR
jgi:hypothetical protein